MPIYEYECTNCGSVEEALQKFSDKPLKKCHHCSGKLHKIVSQSTFHLKGTGWYVTDYANKSKDSNKQSKSNESESTSKTQSKKSESKSAASTASKKSSDKSVKS
jgi:putative FmdB family regulatory protein